MNYEFMSIGTNCGPIEYLGPKRNKGPVDNVVIRDAWAIKYLVDNNYYNYICNEKNFNIVKPSYHTFGPNEWFIYQYVKIIHNDPRLQSYKDELKKRCEAFNQFLTKVRENDNYYFTLTLNEDSVDTTTHCLKDRSLYWILEYLKKENLLNKTIFVQLHSDGIPHGQYCNCYINDIKWWREQYDLKVIDLYTIGNHINSSELQEQFRRQVIKLLSKINQNS